MGLIDGRASVLGACESLRFSLRLTGLTLDGMSSLGLV
jgi:hypothetical protein